MFDFSQDDIRILRETIRRVKEGLPIGGFRPAPTPRPQSTETAWVKLTSTTLSSGRYPARRWYWDEETSAMVDTSEVVWADTPNGETLASTSTYYAAQFTGILDADGKAVYQVMGQFSSGTASPLTTKGDLWGYSTVDARLAVGTNNYVLTADSTQSLGIKWAASSSSILGFHGCRVSRSTTQSISANTGTAIGFDGETFDTDSYHDNSSNNTRITIPTGLGGYYMIGGCIQWAGLASDTEPCGPLIRVNGGFGFNIATHYGINPAPATPTDHYQTICTVYNLSQGDYVELLGSNGSAASARTIQVTSGVSPIFWAYLIGT